MSAKFIVTLAALGLLSYQQGMAQSVNVDVNLDIKHSVGGVSDFGRDRHITVHSSLAEGDWDGEHEKLNYLLNDLDVYLGRDNGSATWKFQATPVDPERPNHADLSTIEPFAQWWNEQYEIRIKDRTQYADKSTHMVCGTNPHPTYPTLCYWHMCGDEGAKWIPQDIETSTEWMVEYLDKSFSASFDEEGELMPEYWEVINEPDMLLNTGAFMVSSWEDIWEYHNLVAKGVKERMGNRAPKIGGMTWGLHDFFANDLNRARTVDYADRYYGDTEADEVAKAYARKQVESDYLNVNGPWTQWDVLWRGFMDHAGDNMDFYSVHVYDWPTYDATGGAIRSGGHTEAMLEMIEWYDVHKNGKENRKPLVVSEYGAVQGAWDYKSHDKRYDWECIKPFNSMFMQFLERPDYIEKTMPFTPIKATWGDTDENGDGTPEYRYQYTMMRDDDMDGNWEWSDYIKWYQLWAEVEGTRVDTHSADPDIQVDSYINGNTVFLILNNLEPNEKDINLNTFGNTSNQLQNVNIKHLYLQGTDEVVLANNTVNSAPENVHLGADATMILKYTYANSVAINETSIEKKYFGESVGGGDLHRISTSNGDNEFKVNNVSIPANGEAMLKITGSFFDAEQTPDGFLSIVSLKVNGQEVEAPYDWRGERQNRSKYFGTLEIPVPMEKLQQNNTFTIDFKHNAEITVANLVVWEFSKTPGRTTESTEVTQVPVTGIEMISTTAEVEKGALKQLTTAISPSNATNQKLTWTSSDETIAKVDASGIVHGISTGMATITATTDDGSFSASSTVTVVFTPIAVTNLELSSSALELEEGDSKAIFATIEPSHATDKSIVWTSSNPAVATVATDGTITAVNQGTAIITAQSNDGGFSEECSVTVTEKRVRTGQALTIEAEALTATGGSFSDGTVTGGGVRVVEGVGIDYVNTYDWASYTINVPKDAQYDVIYYISSPNNGTKIQLSIDDEVLATDAVPNNGVWDNYQALKSESYLTLTAGEHTVKITAASSAEWQWNLDKIVLNELVPLGGEPTDPTDPTPVAVSGVSLDVTAIAVTPGQTQALVATIQPTNAENKKVQWSSSDASVAIVSADGVVTSVTEGTAIISVVTNDGGFTEECTVTVTEEPGNTGQNLTIEAEDLIATGGTYIDGTVTGGGVHVVEGLGINYVNTNDWATYTISVPKDAEYDIVYYISTPIDGTKIQLSIDDVNIATDAVPNNGEWDNYQALQSESTLSLTAGEHTVKIAAASSAQWQWNLDKIVLNELTTLKESANVKSASTEKNGNSTLELSKVIDLYPNPTDEFVTIHVRGGAVDGSQPMRVQIVSMQGQFVKQSEIVINQPKKINISDLAAGVYFVQIKGMAAQKLIVK